MTSITPLTGPSAPAPPSGAGRDWSALGQADFIKLLTVQLRQQDPTDPVDNKEMLAQMAQFSSLSGISQMGGTLRAIETKLDALLATRAAPS